MIINVTMIYYDLSGMQHVLYNCPAMVEKYSYCVNYDIIKPFIEDGSLNGIVVNNDDDKIIQCCGYSFDNGLYSMIL